MSEEKKQKRTASVSRYPGQRIFIGDSIVVRISRVEGKRVYVYVEGPQNLTILRPDKEVDQSDRDAARQGLYFDRESDETVK